MTLARTFSGLMCLAALCGSLPAAHAQDSATGIDRALGNWSFQSVPYRDDTCQMSGTMQIRIDPQTGSPACAFTAVEACIGEDRWIVEQVCSIEQRNDQLSIRSSITNFIEADEFTGSYVPDHFVLTIESANRMSGRIISAITAGVEFMRKEEAVS